MLKVGQVERFQLQGNLTRSVHSFFSGSFRPWLFRIARNITINHSHAMRYLLKTHLFRPKKPKHAKGLRNEMMVLRTAESV